MERRSRSKMMVNENDHEEKTKNQPKIEKMEEEIAPDDRTKELKENMLISLANVFLENKNDPSLIYPWMKDFKQLEDKIIGCNYIVQGPSQSGKYSSVKYAIEMNNSVIQEILINCDVSATEYQIYERLIDEFITKCDKCNWPKKREEIRKIFSPENIEFEKLNPYLIKGKVKFVIVIRNAEHLFGFKNQSILYNLFEWMRSEEITERGGLVLISRQLRLTDKFEKRVKSRFCGTRLCIFRPEKPEIYTKIITKRISAVIDDKETWFNELKFSHPNELEKEEMIYDSDEDMTVKVKKRGRTPKKSAHKEENITFEDIIESKEKEKSMEEMDEYVISLQSFLTLDAFQDLQINNEMIQTVMEIAKLKSNKKGSEVFTHESLLTPEEQIKCLIKLKEAFENNEELEKYLEKKIMCNQIITIPFVLMVMQHIFIRLDEILIKNLPIEKLKKLVQLLFEKNVEYQFPTHDIEGNSLENLNNVDIMLLTLIYKFVLENKPTVKLTTIYADYKARMNISINKSYDRSANNLPLLLIERSLQNLYRNRIVTYQLHNLWNSEINLIYSLPKIKLGLEMVASKRKITEIMKELFEEANIYANYRIKKNELE